MKNEKLTRKNIFYYLLKKVPSFNDSYKKRLKPTDLETFFTDFTQFLLDEYHQVHLKRESSDQSLQVIQNGLDIMEKAIRSPDLELQELVSVYFLENLQGEEYYEEIREMLGPSLREELRHWE